MPRIKGSALAVKEIKKFIENSSNGGTYDNSPVYDYQIDNELSNNFVHVYFNPDTKKVVVVVRGSATLNDAIVDLRLLFGHKEDDRFGIAKIIIERAIAKYGAGNITVVGSSLGGIIAEDTAQQVHNIITFNKAAPPSEINKNIPANQFDIRTKNDIVSFLTKYQKHENPVVTIPSESLNFSTEHRYPVLDRLDPNMMIGTGKKRKPTVRELKTYIKENRKHSGQKILITGLKKRELYNVAQQIGYNN